MSRLLSRLEKLTGDSYRDRPRTRIKQILDIFVSVAKKEISPGMTDLEDIFPPKKKKPNPGWKNLEKYNQKRIAVDKKATLREKGRPQKIRMP